MPLAALTLVLFAALLHAFWNLLAKDSRDSSAFMWWGVTFGAAWFGLWVSTQQWLGLPPQVWLPFAVSIAAEIGYLVAITRGYSAGDLSQVYPIARGAPPLLIAFLSALVFAERLPAEGYAGILLLMFGVYLASLPSLDDALRPLRALAHRPAQWALLAAVFVAVYSTLDKYGVAYTDPLVYNVWVYVGISVFYAPFVWSGKNRTSTICELKRSWRRIVIGSGATIGSYLFALTGMALTSASYVGAVRASSVVIGALFGWLWLRERFGVVRVFAAATMVVGLALVAAA